MSRSRPTIRPALSIVLLIVVSPGCNRGATGRRDAPAATTRPVTSAAPSSQPFDWRARETSLSDVVQLTNGFERAGEAYFSADANWIIFQATPPGEQHYQMYVARLRRTGDRITGADTPVRISPPNSRNTCGLFSPDGRTLIFASTAGKEDPNEPAAGYQRQGGNYRWDFPNGMEIYRADRWQAAVEEAMKRLGQLEDTLVGTAPGSDSRAHLHDSYASVDLAKHAITNNNAYDAEGAFSPDGKWIVFGSRRDGDSELYVMRADGSNPVRLTHSPGYDGGPFFSPEGRRVVYRSDRKGNDLLLVFTADLAFDADGNITGTRN